MTTDTEDILARAAQAAGIDARGATLVRDGSNAIYRLPGERVARVGRPGASTVAAREVAVSHWLTGSGLPVVQPLSDIAQDLVIDDHPVTWWALLPPHETASPAELASVLSILHSLPVPASLDLPHFDPFAGLRDIDRQAGVLDAAEAEWLQQTVADAHSRYTPDQECTVIHGDAWQGNLARTDTGQLVLLDLEHVSLGRPDWDLIQVAVDHTDFARITDTDYKSFVSAYGGHDVTRSDDYRVLADIQELRWVTFALRKVATNTRARDEVRHRIACLRGKHPRPWTWHAL